MDNDWRIPDEDLDPLAPIKGLIAGTVIGALVWAVIGFSIWWIFFRG